jgi:hypothetical protein
MNNILDWRGEGNSYVAIVGNTQMVCKSYTVGHDWLWKVQVLAGGIDGYGAQPYRLAHGEAVDLADAQAQAEAYVVGYVASLSPVLFRAIHANVDARGYLAGWDSDQLVARQMAKMIEELAEACEQLRLPRGLAEAIYDTGALARQYFDTPEAWDGAGVADVDRFLAELADVAVVLAVAAATINGNVLSDALAKSARDAGRGVR